MKRLLSALLLSALVPASTATAQAVKPYIPPSLYPTGATISFNPDFSNQQMDAAWDYDPIGEPLMHTYSQGTFLRQSGWMEQAFVQRKRQIAWFAIYDSEYGIFDDGHQGNRTAFQDLRRMLNKWWHAPLATQQPASLLPPNVTGSSQARIIPKVGDGPYVVASAWWGSSHEVEGIGYTSSRSVVSRSQLREMLYAQLRYAVRLQTTSAPSP